MATLSSPPSGAAEMTVATRDIKHVELLGVRCVNPPWEPTV
ncbi:hypothetical protein Rhow_000731 [Rhodococcus wratislaviensis]|uniref:Uncharacterized protein n=1 Tax=Rhodococcus wratislaviensis TaxID=44752 RepID=A0A402C2Q1_RHOWR|nr:hypothetical protein [Rhodococcus wratislaviensis]GCE37847.1 hypothetical protein Rhow_000731 [Rhodococcus wratislaviensis]